MVTINIKTKLLHHHACLIFLSSQVLPLDGWDCNNAAAGSSLAAALLCVREFEAVMFGVCGGESSSGTCSDSHPVTGNPLAQTFGATVFDVSVASSRAVHSNVVVGFAELPPLTSPFTSELRPKKKTRPFRTASCAFFSSSWLVMLRREISSWFEREPGDGRAREICRWREAPKSPSSRANSFVRTQCFPNGMFRVLSVQSVTT